MPEIISNIRFLEYGKKAPKGSRFKGVLTTESIVGYYNYTSRKEAAEESMNKGMNENGLLGYTSRAGDLRTYTHLGWMKDDKDLKSLIKQSFCKKGNLIWDTVISLENYMIAGEKQLRNADDYVAVISKILPSFFKYAGFEPSNMAYWMNYHSDKSHPHIHLAFFEINQSITKGKLPQKDVDKFKSLFIKEVALRQEFQKKYGMNSKEFFKLCDADKQNMLSSIKERDFSNLTDLQSLYHKLPHGGRLSYNSQPMAKYRKEIDQITDQILAMPDIQPLYQTWLDKVTQLDTLQNDYANDEISKLQETELSKLHIRIGNIILQSFKGYRQEMSTTEMKIPSERIQECEHGKYVAVGNKNMILGDDFTVIEDDMVNVDLTQDEYLFVDPNTGDSFILDHDDVVEELKQQMKNDEKSNNQPDKRIVFSGYHSRQARNTFPNDAALNRAVHQAISQQIHEKEKDLEVFLNKKKSKEKD